MSKLLSILIPPPDKKNSNKDLLVCKDQAQFCLHAKCNRECLEDKICLFDSENNQYIKLKVKSTFNKWLKNDLLDWISE